MYLEEQKINISLSDYYLIYFHYFAMTRSLKKWFYVNPKLLSRVQNMIQSWEKKVLKVYDRACQIVPDLVGFTFAVHNGKQFITVYVVEEMIGHRLWEFAPTRKFTWHPF